MINNTEILELATRELEEFNRAETKLGITLYYGRAQLLLSILAQSKTHTKWATKALYALADNYNRRLGINDKATSN